MAMLAVWMTRAVHMKGRKVRMVEITSGLLVNSAGRNITMHPARRLSLESTAPLPCLSWEISMPANRVLCAWVMLMLMLPGMIYTSR